MLWTGVRLRKRLDAIEFCLLQTPCYWRLSDALLPPKCPQAERKCVPDPVAGSRVCVHEGKRVEKQDLDEKFIGTTCAVQFSGSCIQAAMTINSKAVVQSPRRGRKGAMILNLQHHIAARLGQGVCYSVF